MVNPNGDLEARQGTDNLEPLNPYESAAISVEATNAEGTLNPWFSMMNDPRATVRQLIDSPRRGRAFLLAMLSGVFTFVVYVGLSYPPLEEDVWLRFILLAMSVVFGAVFGVVHVFLHGLACAFVGRSLGGTGTSRECRTAIAWSKVPSMWLLPLYLAASVYACTLGFEILVLADNSSGSDDIQLDYVPWIKTAIGVAAVVSVWQLYLASQGVGEAHRFRSLRGFATVFIGGAIATALLVAVLATLDFLLAVA
ncbi:Yip1 family protein [Aeoliella sp. SH292]|uniref:Yip1 family protein n=1 Tax=Aeoliella sp. SH292 TaxID=3454464 RepID=UPI003F96EF23